MRKVMLALGLLAILVSAGCRASAGVGVDDTSTPRHAVQVAEAQ